MKINKVDKIKIQRKINESLDWELIRQKSVTDSDGFDTEYAWYTNADGTRHVFIFGDSDMYNPDNTEWDWECDTYEEAKEWFEGYNGLEEDEEDLDDYVDEGLLINEAKQFSSKELSKLETELIDDLKNYNLFPEDGTFSNADTWLELTLQVDGDWKHDHLATEYVVEQFARKKGWTIVRHNEQEIGNSQSDWYEATHTWFFNTGADRELYDSLDKEILDEDMKRFHFEYMVDGVKSEQTISALNMKAAEELIKKQYTDKSVSITKREEIKESLEEDFDDVPDAPATPTENGVASVINTLIQDEWQAISQYNDAIVTIQDAFPNESILNILKDIAAEEHRHVGQLQAALGLVSPASEEISLGEEEGVEQINEIPSNTQILQQATTPMNFDDITLGSLTTLSDDEIDDTI